MRPVQVFGIWFCFVNLTTLAVGPVAEGQIRTQTVKVPEGVEYLEDVVYGKGGDVELHLDLAKPRDSTEPRPCVLVIHGGAWRGGDKRMHAEQVLDLAQRGYVAATIQYRLCPKAAFPAQVEDVKCAVRYLRAHHEQYGLDKGRLGAVGFSAGAHLAMLLGVMGPDDGLEGSGGWPDESSQVQAVVSFAGPTELGAADIPEVSRPLVRDFLGGTREERPEAYRQSSPVTYASRGDAAVLLFQGTKDPLVPFTQAFRMVERLTEAEVPGRVELLLGAGHGWSGTEQQRSFAEMYTFLEQRLKSASAE